MNIAQMSLSASVLIVAVVTIRALALHKLPKKTFLVLWGVVICRLLVPFSIPSRFSFYTGIDMVKRMFAERTDVSSPVGMASISNMVNMPGTAEPMGVGASAVSISPIEIVWLVGMCACALFFIASYIKCRREFKTSLPVENDFAARWLREHSLLLPVQIRQSDRIKAPLTYGVFRPVVLLPKTTDWTDETKLRYILTHEFTHIRRFDALTKLVLAAALCVHWFNPLVWVMYVLANRDLELACDETVVRTFGETMKSAYASMLVCMEEKKSGLTPLVNNFSKNAIEQRIVSIMKIKKCPLPIIILAVLLVAGVTVGFATSNASTSHSNTSPLPDHIVLDDVKKNIDKASRIIADNSPQVGNPEEGEAGSPIYENEPTRVYVGPSKRDENVRTRFYPIYHKYHLERTAPDTGKHQVSIDDGSTWLYYRDNPETHVSEISADEITWYDFEAALLASEFGNCRYYLERNDPNGKCQVSYDDGITWLFWRHNDETQEAEVSADGVAWKPAPSEW